MNRFFVTLQTGFIHRHLQEINATPDPLVLPRSLTMKQLRPLLDFTNLKSIHFLHFDVTLDDHEDCLHMSILGITLPRDSLVTTDCDL